MPLPYPFHTRRREPPTSDERLRVERGLAVARLVLAMASLVAIDLDPTEPAGYADLAYTLMLLYLQHSAVVALMVHQRDDITNRFAGIVHAVDVLWPAVISLFTEGPNSPFFLLFFFSQLAAAFRWGFRATMTTATTGVLLMVTEAGLLSVSGSAGHLMEGQFELNRLIMRSAYLLLMGFLLGYAAEEEKQLRAEDVITGRIAAKARTETGSLSATAHAVLDDVMRVFEAPSVLAVVSQIPSGRTFLWEVRGTPGPKESALQMRELYSDEQDVYLFDFPAHTWYARRRPQRNGAADWQITALDADGRRLRDFGSASLPSAFQQAASAESLLASSFALGEDWAGRLFVFEPRPRTSIDNELRFTQNLVRRVAPGIYNLFLVRRLRSRAGAIERARAARELHDGAIQSLISAEMQVDVLRRRAASPVDAELSRIQDILRDEVLSLRELMLQMKPVDVGPRDLLEFLAETVERFHRDTGIAAVFVAEPEEVALDSHTCRELARIVQEALFNVRKHSRARSVVVRFSSDPGLWKLAIDDDGCGFGFSGRMTADELERQRLGPVVIRERVRLIGGQLILHSTPGRGARLEINIPQKARAYAR